MSATIASPPGVVRRALRGTGARFGLAIAVVFLVLTVFAPLVAPFDPYEQDLSNALSPPSALHWFGADQYGRDTLSRILYGTRTALLAIVMADGLALLLGGSLGLVAGYLGGRVDALIMRLVDVLLAFPYLLLALIIVAVLGPSLTNSVIAIGIIYTPQYARLMRGQVLIGAGGRLRRGGARRSAQGGCASCCATCCRTALPRCWCWPRCSRARWWWRLPDCRSSALARSRRRPTGARCSRTGTAIS